MAHKLVGSYSLDPFVQVGGPWPYQRLATRCHHRKRVTTAAHIWLQIETADALDATFSRFRYVDNKAPTHLCVKVACACDISFRCNRATLRVFDGKTSQNRSTCRICPNTTMEASGFPEKNVRAAGKSAGGFFFHAFVYIVRTSN